MVIIYLLIAKWFQVFLSNINNTGVIISMTTKNSAVEDYYKN